MATTTSTLKSERMLISMGPQHPSTHGVLRLLLQTDGEVVEHAEPHIGYLHRCAEKIGENLTYQQFTPYTDRMDYLASMNENWAWCRAAEEMCGLEVPPRGEYIRVIIGELNRIASHLVALGTFGLDTGAFTPFLLAFREREACLTIFEAVCGARLTYNYIRVGGVLWDLLPEHVEMITKFLDQFEAKVDSLDDLLTNNLIFIRRTANIGTLSAEQAIEYGWTGPNLRASGVDWDLRRDEPYSVYPELEFDVPVGHGMKGETGDSWDRYWVRVQEMRQAVRLIRQALDQLPPGDHCGKVPKVMKAPKGREVYVRTENPRGELAFYLISEGKNIPYRVKVRAPTFVSLCHIEDLWGSMYVADLVAAVGSLDIVMGQVDR
jgi:NADH-quinone oxidoreductase subunit D